MKVLSLGTDERVFQEGSAVRERLRAYAQAMGSIECVILSKRGHDSVSDGALTLHAAPASSPIIRLVRALFVGAALPQPDVVTAQDPFEVGLVGLLLAWRFGIPLHVQVHTDFLSPAYAQHSFLNNIRLIVAPILIKSAVRIRVVSEDVGESIRLRYHPRATITVLPVYADLTRYRELSRNPEHGELLWVGRFEPEKNPLLALSAFAALRASGVTAHLTLLGAGSLEGELKANAKRLGVGQSVSFPGWLDPISYLSKAELVIATSRYEGYGLSIVEARAAGVPVLSTDVGVARRSGALITNDVGFSEALREWFAHPSPAVKLTDYPYQHFNEYVSKVAEDVRACIKSD